ncbi:hypothetical protein [Taklimakanibacter deserti]|uniref:hypothetical protein n=1 Tax=Taklimakanibacter deserti TaxID=2267839 RepID=UPI000E6528B9
MSISLTAQDQELLARRFSIADPKSLSDLADEVPADFAKAKLEFEYDIRPGGPITDWSKFVVCAHCGTRHGRGFVMKAPSGARFLTGKDCGAKIYRLDFHDIEQEFEHGKARQYDLHRVITCLPLLKPVGAALQALAQDIRFQELEEVQRRFRFWMTELYQHLRAAADRPDHQLVVFEVIPDEQGMRERAARNKEIREERAKMTVTERKRRWQAGQLRKIEDESKPMTKRQEKTIMILRGHNFLKKSVEDIAKLLEGRGRLAGLMYGSLAGHSSHQLDNAKLAEACRKIQEFVEGIDKIEQDLRDVLVFFDSAHLKGIADYASNTHGCKGSYSAMEGGLIFNPRGGDDPAVVGIPKKFELPSFDCVEPLRRALSISLISKAA